MNVEGPLNFLINRGVAYPQKRKSSSSIDKLIYVGRAGSLNGIHEEWDLLHLTTLYIRAHILSYGWIFCPSIIRMVRNHSV